MTISNTELGERAQKAQKLADWLDFTFANSYGASKFSTDNWKNTTAELRFFATTILRLLDEKNAALVKERDAANAVVDNHAAVIERDSEELAHRARDNARLLKRIEALRMALSELREHTDKYGLVYITSHNALAADDAMTEGLVDGFEIQRQK